MIRDRGAELERLKESADPHRRGFEFQRYVRSLFAAQHFKVTMNARGARPRQVDLMATSHDVTYLVEVKWTKRPSDIDDIDSLLARLGETPASVIGVFVSWAGFTKTAVQRVQDKRLRPVLLVTGAELERTTNLVHLLRRKQQRLLVAGEVVVDDDGGHTFLTGKRMQLPTPTPFEFNFLRQQNHDAGHLWQPMMPAELGRQREPHA